MSLYIAVVGPSSAQPHEAEVAEAVGRALAERGAVVLCGGLGGAMEAACRGAKSAGGTTVGILPGSDRGAANEFVDVAIATGLGEARNVIVVRTADAVIAVAGAYGTLSEIALALAAGKKVIGLNTWQLSRAGEPDGGIEIARSPREAVKRALTRSSCEQ
ncbi:MAG: TIGR00725 family protein [Thermoleophilaceae bacterium]